jgi:hypothetical protein
MDLGDIVWGGLWSGFTWLRIGTVGWLLWMRRWTFGFWRRGVSQPASRGGGVATHYSEALKGEHRKKSEDQITPKDFVKPAEYWWKWIMCLSLQYLKTEF